MRRGVWHRLLAAVATVVLLVAAGCTADDTDQAFDEDVAAQLDAVVERGAEQTADGGLVVRVDAPAGQRTLAAGPADVDSGDELTGDEAFRIGSITKLFTATVALQLAEEGVVDLDVPIADLLPERAAELEHEEEVTLRQLLGHTAGLPRDPEPAFFAEAWELNSVEDSEVAASCSTVADADLDPLDYLDGDALFAPGSDWAYSNVGYFLAGAVIEAATDEPLEEAYRSRILQPLGMEETWLDCAEEPRGELAAGIHPPGVDLPLEGFEGINSLAEEADEPLDVSYEAMSRAAGGAAGGLVSTPGDLTVFADALFGGELFDDPATLETMLESGPNDGYGLGVAVEGDVVGHFGTLLGYDAALLRDTQREIVVVGFTNGTAPPRGDSHAYRATTRVMDIVQVMDPG